MRRLFARQPAYATAAVLCVAVTVASVCLFQAVARGLSPQRIPVPHPAQLYDVQLGDAHGRPQGSGLLPLETFDALRRALPDDSALGYVGIGLAVGHPGAVRLVTAERVSAEYFAALELLPQVGTLGFSRMEERAEGSDAVVISGRLWRRLCATTTSLGRCDINVNGRPMRVRGVAPEHFRGLWAPEFSPTDVWVPLGHAATMGARVPTFDQSLGVLVKVRWREANAGSRDVPAALRGIAHGVAVTIPDGPAGTQLLIAPGATSRMTARATRSLGMVAASLRVIAVLVLAIAALTLANLALARALARTGELAIRRALGASERAVTVWGVQEAFVLVLLGTAAGLLASVPLLRGVGRLLAAPLPGGAVAVRATLDPTDVGWALLAASVLIVVAAATTMRHLFARNVGDLLQGEGATAAPRVSARRFALLLPQLSVAIALLVMTGALMTQARELAATSQGATLATVTTLTLARVTPPPTHAEEAADTTAAASHGNAVARALGELQADSGGALARVAVASQVPFAFGMPARRWVVPEDGPSRHERRVAAAIQVAGAYGPLLGCQTLVGDWFRSDEGRVTPLPAVVNDRLGDMLAGENPHGLLHRAISMTDGEDAAGRPQYRELRIVGVVRCPTDGGVGPAVFVPFHAEDLAHLYVFVQGRSVPELRALRERLDRAGTGFHVTDASTLTDYEHARVAPLYSAAIGTVLVGLMALTLTAVGLSGMVLYLVRSRAHETAIRVVCGSTPGTALRAVLAPLWPVLAGALALGLLGAWGIGHVLGWSVWTSSGLTLVAAVLVVMMCAALVPAWRVTVTDPAVVLRRA